MAELAVPLIGGAVSGILSWATGSGINVNHKLEGFVEFVDTLKGVGHMIDKRAGDGFQALRDANMNIAEVRRSHDLIAHNLAQTIQQTSGETQKRLDAFNDIVMDMFILLEKQLDAQNDEGILNIAISTAEKLQKAFNDVPDIASELWVTIYELRTTANNLFQQTVSFFYFGLELAIVALMIFYFAKTLGNAIDRRRPATAASGKPAAASGKAGASRGKPTTTSRGARSVSLSQERQLRVPYIDDERTKQLVLFTLWTTCRLAALALKGTHLRSFGPVVAFAVSIIFCFATYAVKTRIINNTAIPMAVLGAISALSIFSIIANEEVQLDFGLGYCPLRALRNPKYRPAKLVECDAPKGTDKIKCFAKPEGLGRLRAIPDDRKIVVVSFLGIRRKGKSTLATLAMRHYGGKLDPCWNHARFESGPGTGGTRVTNGIDMVIVDGNDGKTYVFLDAEGTLDTERNKQGQLATLTIAAALSHRFFYHVAGSLKEDTYITSLSYLVSSISRLKSFIGTKTTVTIPPLMNTIMIDADKCAEYDKLDSSPMLEDMLRTAHADYAKDIQLFKQYFPARKLYVWSTKGTADIHLDDLDKGRLVGIPSYGLLHRGVDILELTGRDGANIERKYIGEIEVNEGRLFDKFLQILVDAVNRDILTAHWNDEDWILFVCSGLRADVVEILEVAKKIQLPMAPTLLEKRIDNIKRSVSERLSKTGACAHHDAVAKLGDPYYSELRDRNRKLNHFEWKSTPFSACMGPCPTGKMLRKVWCQRGDGQKMNDQTLCHEKAKTTDPTGSGWDVEEKPCKVSKYGYKDLSDWGPCKNINGVYKRTKRIQCTDCGDVAVPNSRCEQAGIVDAGTMVCGRANPEVVNKVKICADGTVRGLHLYSRGGRTLETPWGNNQDLCSTLVLDENDCITSFLQHVGRVMDRIEFTTKTGKVFGRGGGGGHPQFWNSRDSGTDQCLVISSLTHTNWGGFPYMKSLRGVAGPEYL